MAGIEDHLVLRGSGARKPEAIWGYLVAGVVNCAAMAASVWLAGVNLSGFGIAFLAWPLLIFHLAACFPLTVLAVIPRKSRKGRMKLAILLVTMLVVSFAINLYTIVNYKGGDD